MKTLHFLPAILWWMILTLSPSGKWDHLLRERLAGFYRRQIGLGGDYEALLKPILIPAVCQQHNRALSAHPTLVGSDWDWWNVQYSLEQLRSYGLQPELKTYYVYMSSPRSIQVEMVRPPPIQPGSRKTPGRGRSISRMWWWVITPTRARRGHGDLVYVNYGRLEDYDQLAQLGVSVQGRSPSPAMARIFRGVKNRWRTEHGAIGLSCSPDPADDGYLKGPVYPYGPWRPADGIQRGTVLYLFNYAGDPLTPRMGSHEQAHRLDPRRRITCRMPCRPRPCRIAKRTPLLAAMGGPEVPAGWQGGLPFTYHLGPGPARVHLKLDIDYQIKPIWDIVVKIPGSKYPDQWVVLGAHRDGWTYGRAIATAVMWL